MHPLTLPPPSYNVMWTSMATTFLVLKHWWYSLVVGKGARVRERGFLKTSATRCWSEYLVWSKNHSLLFYRNLYSTDFFIVAVKVDLKCISVLLMKRYLCSSYLLICCGKGGFEVYNCCLWRSLLQVSPAKTWTFSTDITWRRTKPRRTGYRVKIKLSSRRTRRFFCYKP